MVCTKVIWDGSVDRFLWWFGEDEGIDLVLKIARFSLHFNKIPARDEFLSSLNQLSLDSSIDPRQMLMIGLYFDGAMTAGLDWLSRTLSSKR